MMRTATPPDIHPLGRYTSGQAAEVLGVSRTTFYRYVKAGKIAPRINRGSTRPYYSGRELQKLWQIL